MNADFAPLRGESLAGCVGVTNPDIQVVVRGKYWQGETYELLVCDIISVGAERLRSPVVLSQPSFIGKEAGGIHAHSFLECDDVFRKDPYANAVLSSCTLCTTIFQRFGNRMTKESTALTPLANPCPRGWLVGIVYGENRCSGSTWTQVFGMVW